MSYTLLLFTLINSAFGSEAKSIRCYATDEHKVTHVIDFLSEGEKKVEGIEKVLAKGIYPDQAVALDDMATLKSPLILSEGVSTLSHLRYMTHIKVTKENFSKEEKWIYGNTICYSMY